MPRQSPSTPRYREYPAIEDGDALRIPVCNGRGHSRRVVTYAIVNNDDFGKSLGTRPWCFSDGYAKCRVGNSVSAMHRIVYDHYHGERPRGAEVDHRDRNKLNNRPDNLFLVGRGINSANRGKRSDGKSSPFKCVNYDSRNRRWGAQVKKDGRHVLYKHFRAEDGGELMPQNAIGTITDVQLFDRPLTAEEVKELYETSRVSAHGIL